MNRRQRIIAGVGLAAICLMTACSKEEAAEATHTHHDHEQMSSTEPLSGQSVYQLESRWTNQSGEAVSLSDLRGKVVVLAMVYTHCDNACPRIIADMRLIRGELEDKAEQLQFVLVSIDPQRDTVERLQSFGDETGLTRQGWTLLRGGESDIRELAAVFGVQYRRVSADDFAHSNVISVLDPQGVILHQQKGLGVRFDATVSAITNILPD